jgi:hypothetical protein
VGTSGTGASSRNWKKRADASPSPRAGNAASSGWRRSIGASRSAGRVSTVSPSGRVPGSAEALRLRPSGCGSTPFIVWFHVSASTRSPTEMNRPPPRST